MSSYSAPGYSSSGGFQATPAWIESWLPELPLHTILTLVSQLSPLISSLSSPTDAPTATIVRTIQNAQIRGIDPSPIKIQYFEWTPLSLGWYESLLWSFVYTSEIQIQKGTAGVWTGTHVKLFRVENVAATGPTLNSPRGAVDAVGSNIVSRIGNINLRGVGGSEQSAASGATGGQQPQEARSGTAVGTGPLRSTTI